MDGSIAERKQGIQQLFRERYSEGQGILWLELSNGRSHVATDIEKMHQPVKIALIADCSLKRIRIPTGPKELMRRMRLEKPLASIS